MSELSPRARPGPRPTVQLIVRLDPDLKARLSRLAARDHRYESRIVEDAITQLLAREEQKGGSRSGDQ